MTATLTGTGHAGREKQSAYRAQRVMQLLDLVGCYDKGVTYARATRSLGVTQRTVERYLRELVAAGMVRRANPAEVPARWTITNRGQRVLGA